MDHFKSLQSQDGAKNNGFNDSPRYETRPELLYENLQTGAGVRAASIATEQHSKNKVFRFAEEAFHSGPRQKVLSPRTRQSLRGGMLTHGPQERINLHHVETNITSSRSPPGNIKQLLRLHSAKNLVRRAGEEDYALMAHYQDSAGDLCQSDSEEVNEFHQENKLSKLIKNEKDTNQLRHQTAKTIQREGPSDQNQKKLRRTLMESAQKSINNQAIATGSSAQRSINPKAMGIQEKISPQKVTKDTNKLGRLQKSPSASQPNTQFKGESWLLQEGHRSNSNSQQKNSHDQSPPREIQLPNLNRLKSKMSSTMSALSEDAGQQILDSSLNQSFTLSQTNYQVTEDMQANPLLYGVVSQSNLREGSDFWKSATSQTSAPLTKLQSEQQSCQPAKEKLTPTLNNKQERQQMMTQKKIKPMQKLTNSCKKEHHDRTDQKNRVEPIEQKVLGFHRAQQSMELATNLYKIDQGIQKKQRGTKVYLEKKTDPSPLQPEEIKTCLTERAGKAAAGSSTTSAATQNKNLKQGSSSGPQTCNERSCTNRAFHHHHHQKQPNDSIVSNQTTGGGSTGSRRSNSSKTDLRSGEKKRRRKHHHPSITELGSAQQTPKGAYFSISRQLAPSNSSIPPSSCADDKSSSQGEEYQSMWADISKSIGQTNESNSKTIKDGDSQADLDHDTEFSGHQPSFYNQSMFPSNLGQADLNSSFQGSQSQASQWGQDLDSSFYESATSQLGKSDRNVNALKSQHNSCSQYSKQTGTGGQTTIANLQQQPQTMQQSSQVAQHQQQLQQQTSYIGQPYTRRPPSEREENKQGVSSQIAGPQGVSYLQQHQSGLVSQSGTPASCSVPHDEVNSTVSSSASSAQKFIIQQQKTNHRVIKGSSINSGPGGAMAMIAASSSQQTLTSSASHQQMVQHHSMHQGINSLPAISPSTQNNRHSASFNTSMEKMWGPHSSRATAIMMNHEENGASSKNVMIDASRTQMSQSVQPTSNRNNNVVSNHHQIIGQFSQQTALQNQAVSLTHHQQVNSMSATRQHHPHQYEFPSPVGSSNVIPHHHHHHNNSNVSVSGFSTGAPINGINTSSGNHNMSNNMNTPVTPQNMQQFTTTMFTPYNPNISGNPSPQQQNNNNNNLYQSAMPNISMMPQFSTGQQAQGMSGLPPQPLNNPTPATMPMFLPNASSHPYANLIDTTPANQFASIPTSKSQQQLSSGSSSSQQTAAQAFNPSQQLNYQLEEIKRFYQAENVPIPRAEFDAFINQICVIPDPQQRHIAQQNLIYQMRQLVSNRQASHRGSFSTPSGVGYDHRRDYSSSSSASKISSSSHHSSVSSQQRSSQQNNLKIALAQAFCDLDSLQTPEERSQFLISKSQLFCKDKNGLTLLKNKIDEEEFKISQAAASASQQQHDMSNNNQRQQPQSKFVEDLISHLFSQEYIAFHKLMMHQVANFFCQEVFKQATKKQLESVLELIKNDFFKVAADMHGTRALQVLLEDELINNEKRTERVSTLIYESLKSGRIFELCCNIRGNHVLRQCLTLLKTDERRSIIYESVVQHFAQVARDKHGCQVVKDCITTAQGQWKKDLIRVSFESIELLINDEFGNFVLQPILEHFTSISKRKTKILDVRYISCVYEFIRQNLGKLCKQQYSSRVVEKAVETMPKEQFEKLCVVFMKNSSKKSKLYREIMLDNYGNYIAPKILERAKLFNLQHQFDYFNKVYRDSIEALKKVKHGRQLMGKMNQIQQQITNNIKGNKQASGSSSANNSGSQQASQQTQDQNQQL